MNTTTKFPDDEAYNVIYSLPYEELLLEVKLRIWLFHHQFIGCGDTSAITQYFDQFVWFWTQKIVSAKPSCSGYGENLYQAHLPFVHQESKSIQPNLKTSPTSAVNLLRKAEFISSGERQYSQYMNSWRECSKQSRDRSKLTKLMRDIWAEHATLSDGSSVFSIDLSKAKTTLIREFTTLVDELKAQMPELQKEKSAWGIGRLKKMRTYRVFQIIDMMILNKYYRLNFSDGLIGKAVFGYDEKGTTTEYDRFRSTQLLFAKQVFSLEGYSKLDSLIASLNKK